VAGINFGGEFDITGFDFGYCGYGSVQEQQRLPQILTKDEIAWGIEKGKITSGDREFAPQTVDLQSAFESAIQAFSDGLYYVFIDDRQYESLDEKVILQPQSKVLFLRLVAMVGG
jgi:hypothetical protein